MISIVIPTKNSAKTLRQCLESIKNQTYRDYELIIVDAFSDDDTEKIARGYADKFFSSDAGMSAARNLGFSKAEGNIFISLDSDMIVEEDVLKEVDESMGGHGGLIIPEVGYGRDYVSRCKDLEKRCYLGDEYIESARAFSAEAFNALKGYDEELLFGEDSEFHSRLKLKYSIGRTDSKLLHNTEHMNFISNLKKAYHYGRSLPKYFARKHVRREHFSPKKMFFVRHFSKLINEPLNAIGLFAIKSMEYSAGFIGYVSAKMEDKNDS
jgi:glycosyltransferase involved in cell wall biosynthesis